MILRHPLRPSSICLFCIQTSHPPRIRTLSPSRPFSSTTPRRTGIPNHYETLGVPTTATAAEIKAQFYALSKRYHPDLNPTDPTASSRFVKISEAYHVLGSPSNRTSYDRDWARTHTHAHHHRSGTAQRAGGSYSSSSAGPAGSRPASGLSRRRTVFRGPPPSFYAQGGYGAWEAKRKGAAHGHAASASGGAVGGGVDGGGDWGGFPGQGQRRWPEDEFDPSIPHWDRAGHFRTHEGLGSRREKARRKDRRWADVEAAEAGGSLLLNFILVGGVVAIIAAVPTWWIAREEGRKAAAAIKVQKKENG